MTARKTEFPIGAVEAAREQWDLTVTRANCLGMCYLNGVQARLVERPGERPLILADDGHSTTENVSTVVRVVRSQGGRFVTKETGVSRFHGRIFARDERRPVNRLALALA